MLLPLSQGVAAVKDDRVVGTALRSDFGDALSTINMIIVDESMRSQGLGRALMTAAMGTAPRSLRLIATMSGRPLYEKLGFEAVGHIACLQGTVTGAGTTPGIRDARAEDLSEIAYLESASFGGDRTALVEWFWNNARMAVYQRGGAISGFAVCRRFGNGHVIGPVVAPSADEGLALIAHMAEGLQGQALRLDVTESSGLEAGLAEMGLAVSYPAPVMQRGPVSTSSDRLALVSQALA